MSVTISYLKSNPSLRPYLDFVDKTLKLIVPEIESRLRLKAVDLVVYVYEPLTLIETGVGGFSANAHLCFLALDPQNKFFERNLELELQSATAHELHHCARYAGPGYGRTLREALLSEGLATIFEEEITKQTPIYASKVHFPQNIREMLLAELDTEQYSHPDWFFGNEKRGIVRWTGYSIAYQTTKAFLSQVSLSAAECATMAVNEIRIEDFI